MSDANPLALRPKEWHCVCGHHYNAHRHTDFNGRCSLCNCEAYVDGPATAFLTPKEGAAHPAHQERTEPKEPEFLAEVPPLLTTGRR